MKPTFLVPSVRPDLMEALLRSWDARPWADQFQMAMALGDYSPEDRDRIVAMAGDRLYRLIELPRTPPFIVRQMVLDACPDVEAWIFLDDDMEFTGETNFSAPLQAIETPGTGCISCNWVRNESPALRARARYEPTFIKQSLVNMSGGMVMPRAVAHLIRDHDRRPYTFCDIQASLISYLAGYENYRYLGSILIHRIMEKSGLKKSYKERAFDPPPSQWLSARPCKPMYDFAGQNHYMPIAKDLMPDAHDEHRRNRALLLPQS